MNQSKTTNGEPIAMKTPSYYRQKFQFLLLALCLPQWPAWGAEAASAPAVVGDLGRKEALVFEGNKVFAAADLRNGLSLHMDYHLAAHPSAPLADFTSTLWRLVMAGYQRGGFPGAKVTVAPDAAARRILVKVEEGPRYRCGEIFLSGVPRLTSEEVRRKIRHALGPRVEAGDLAFGSQGTWMPEHGAPFDPVATNSFRQRIITVLAELGCYQPQIRLKLLPDPARQHADLLIEILDEGPKGVIAQIEVNGTSRNTRADVLRYLELKPGQPLDPKLVTSIRDRLWNAARFVKHEVTPSLLEQPGQYKLTLDLIEFEEAPTLNEGLTPEQKTMLKFCEWLTKGWTNSGDLVADLKLTVNSTDSDSKFASESQAIFSGLGTVLLDKTAGTNARQPFNYAVVASSKIFGFYSPARRRKLVSSSLGLPLAFEAHLMPTGRPKPETQFAFSPMFRFGSHESAAPWWIDLRVAPVAALSLLSQASLSATEHGVLTLRSRPGARSEKPEVELKIDAATGRLTGLFLASGDLIENGRIELRLRSQESAFAHALRQIAATTDEYPNAFNQTNPISSALAFLGTDLLRLDLLRRGLEQSETPESWKQLLSVLQEVDLERLLAPLDPLWAILSRIEGEPVEDEPFLVPNSLPSMGAGSSELGLRTQSDQSALARLARPYAFLVLHRSDTLWPSGSWPWTFTREATLNILHEGQYTPAEIRRLTRSDNLGPLGCLAGEALLGTFDPTLVEALALQGLTKLSPGDFEKDVATLLRGDSVGSRIFVNAGSVLGSLNDQEIGVLAALLGPDLAAFLRDSVQRLRGAPKDQPVAETLRPALAHHWEKVFLPFLQRHFHAALLEPVSRLADQGQLAKAEARQRDLLGRVEAMSAPDKVALGRLLHELGVVLLNQRKLDEAERTLRRALSLRETLNTGERHPWIDSLQYLALTLRQQGKFTDIDTLYRAKVAVLKKPHGHACRTLPALFNQWGVVLLQQGKANEAETMLSEALALQKTLSSETSLDLALPLSSLAVAHWQQNKRTEARGRASEVCALFEKVSGAEHPDSIAWRGLLITLSKPEEKTEQRDSISHPKLPPGLLALVDGRPILQSKVSRRAAFHDKVLRQVYGNQPQKLSAELARVNQEILQQLIEEEMMCSEFRKGGYPVPTNTVESIIDSMMRRDYGNDRSLFLQSLSAAGETEEAFRKRMEKECIISETHRAFFYAVGYHEPSPESIEEYYRSHQSDFHHKESVALSMIVISKDPPDASAPPGSQRKLAEAIRARAVAGEDFATLARTHSAGSTARNGGDWGWGERGTLRTEFEDVAFALQRGQISEVIEIENQFFVMQVRDRRPERLAPLPEAREAISEILEKPARVARQQRWFDRLHSQAVIYK